jgi:poly(3-hydroxybutyrate) depolymerase
MTMKNRQISLVSRTDSVSSPRLRRLLEAALALGVIACSSNDGTTAAAPPAAPPAAPATEPAPSGAGTTTDDVPSAGAETTETAESGTPASAASEGQPVTDLAPPVAEAPSSSDSSAPAAGDGAEADSPPTPPESDPAVPSAGCGRARTLQNGLLTMASGGIQRSYFLQTPEAYDNTRPHRLVFMFHWNYGSIDAIVNPPDADRNTDRPFYGMADLTDDATIFVVPQGLANPGGGAGWANPDNRDVNFTDDMLAAVSEDLCIDTSRVFTTGFSYGAGMSVALACVRPDRFRAAVVYAPAFISGVAPGQCTTPVAFFESHGVDDPIINYQTGLSVLGTFTSVNGCTAMAPADPPADGHGCVSYEGCSVPTRFCNFGAGQGNPFNTSLRGHYPTSKDPGQATSWVPAEAWSFISQF